MTRIIKKPLALSLIPALLMGAYRLWTPGQVITDGHHDRGSNGITLAELAAEAADSSQQPLARSAKDPPSAVGQE